MHLQLTPTSLQIYICKYSTFISESPIISAPHLSQLGAFGACSRRVLS